MKIFSKKTLLTVAILVSLAGCSTIDDTTSTNATTSTASTTSAKTVELASASSQNKDGLFGTYSDTDKETSWNESTATTISLKQDSVKIDGDGATETNNVVTIKSAGTYVLSGSLTDGQLIIDAGTDDSVHIILNGVTLTSSSTAPIYVKQADQTTITLAENTKNTVTDADEYVYPDATTDEPDAAIFSKDDLTINGSGTLTVVANYKNGITSKDDLVITEGTYNITAKNNGIRGKDSVSILGGTFDIDAGNDGIQATNSSDLEKGVINLDGGTFTITAEHDAIQAETNLNISNGTYSVKTGSGSEGAKKTDSSTSETAETSDSYKGLKAGSNLLITNGSFTIDAEDDALHTNGTITIEDGTFSIASGDDGIHADNLLTISGGRIDITKSYEGLEAAKIDISGGTIQLVSSDDGVNAGGGSDGTTNEPGPNGQMDNFSSSGDYLLTISDGTLVIDAGGDGLDSNGDIEMSGGTVIVNGPTSNGDGALDYDGTFTLTGGTLIAAGSSGMAEMPSDASTQASLNLVFSTVQKAGTMVHIASEDGDEVVTFTPKKDFQSLIVSTADLTENTNYTLYSGGTHTGTETNGLYLDGTYTNGTKLTTVSLSSTNTSISETGEAVTTGMGGGMGGGTPPGKSNN